jgi:hypothetical protein
MKKETAKTIAIVLAMAFMFCMGSRLHQDIPIIIQTVVGVLMIIFSILARKKIPKASDE